MMLPCKEIVRILSSDSELPWMKKAEMKMHLMMCRHCSNYAAQLTMLKQGFKKLFSETEATDSVEIKNLEEDVIRKILKVGREK